MFSTGVAFCLTTCQQQMTQIFDSLGCVLPWIFDFRNFCHSKYHTSVPFFYSWTMATNLTSYPFDRITAS